MKNLFACLILASLMACNSSEEENQEKAFFDLAQFIDAEIVYLQEAQPKVHKTVKINDDTETVDITELDWEKELEIIRQSDLNKAAYRLSYDTEGSPNQLVYTLKASESLPIISLTILKDTNGVITQISSKHASDNYLYASNKTATADFKNGHLSHYNVKGSQELFIGSEKVFEIDGRVK